MRSMMPNSDSMSAPRLSDTVAMNRAASWAELGLPAAASGPLICFGPFSTLCSDIHWHGSQYPDQRASGLQSSQCQQGSRAEVEASDRPERAEAYADRMRGAVPAAG